MPHIKLSPLKPELNPASWPGLRGAACPSSLSTQTPFLPSPDSKPETPGFFLYPEHGRLSSSGLVAKVTSKRAFPHPPVLR